MQNDHATKQSRALVFSGFVFEILDKWLYVTAGHILRDIRTALKRDSEFGIWRLDDQMAGNRFGGKSVPYAFDESEWLVLEDESLGVDYAAVPLSWIDRQQLEAGGIIALGRSAWGDHTNSFEHWALIGIPSESVIYDWQTEIKAKVVQIPLKPTAEPVLAGAKAKNQFYAVATPGQDQPFQDADGLSGGPVFSLIKEGDHLVYKIIGVQSGWYSQSKTLAICPFATFAFALEAAVLQRAQERR